MNDLLRIRYRTQEGKEATYEVTHWTEVGRYIKGHSSGLPRTFRKDRVLEYLDGAAAKLTDPFPPPPSLPARSTDDRPQILFTGFPAVQRSDLERRTADAGMKVCKTVTKGLEYLCYGPTAGPTKIEKSREQGVYLLSQAQLFQLLETGELPDDDHDWL